MQKAPRLLAVRKKNLQTFLLAQKMGKLCEGRERERYEQKRGWIAESKSSNLASSQNIMLEKDN